MQSIADALGVPFRISFTINPTIDCNKTPQNYQISLADALKFEFDDYCAQVKRGERQEGSVDAESLARLKQNKHIFVCNIAETGFMIDYSGLMCPCMRLRQKGIPLTQDNFDNIWDSFASYKRLEASDAYKCKSCDIRYYCDICPAEMEFEYGDLEYRPDGACTCAKLRSSFYNGKITREEALTAASRLD
jgi:radical SAM protein with 4Fe4S-binding SPASM domain